MDSRDNVIGAMEFTTWGVGVVVMVQGAGIIVVNTPRDPQCGTMGGLEGGGTYSRRVMDVDIFGFPRETLGGGGGAT